MKQILILMLPLLLVLSGCGGNRTIDIHHVENDEDEENTLQNILSEEKRITDGVAVFLDGDLVIGTKIKPFSRFNKQKIEKKMKKKVEKAFPDKKVIFSTDLKIFWETEKLVDEKSEKKVEDKLKKIEALSKEET